MKSTNLTTSWYSTSFIADSLKVYLEDHGYRILDEPEEKASNCDEVIVASKIFGKEVIEIRGTIENSAASKEETETSKRTKLLTDAMHWLSDVLLSPITFFTNHYGDGKNSLCLPDLEQYREVLDKLSEYFTTNNLDLKVYLVNSSGQVNVVHLNTISYNGEKINIDEEN